MKRRNFFKGLLGLMVIPVAHTAVAREETGSSPAQPSEIKIKWTPKYELCCEFVSKAEWDKINAPIESVYGVRYKMSGMKKYIAHPLFEQAMT